MERKEYSQEKENGFLAGARSYINGVCEKIIYSRLEKRIDVETEKNSKGYFHSMKVDGRGPYKVIEGIDVIELYLKINKRKLDLEGLSRTSITVFIPPKKRFKFK